jgi:hypothetical protein
MKIQDIQAIQLLLAHQKKLQSFHIEVLRCHGFDPRLYHFIKQS